MPESLKIFIILFLKRKKKAQGYFENFFCL
jgi:hypothetical protein